MTEPTKTPQTDQEKAILALETTFNLLVDGAFPISKHDEIKNCLAFIQELHTQMVAEAYPEKTAVNE